MAKNKITDLKQQKNNPNRISLYVDDKYLFGLADTDVLKERLEIGHELSESDIERLKVRSEDAKCLNAALRLVQSRMYTKRELSKKLHGKGYANEVVSYAVSEMEHYGYIDDFQYAQMYVQEVAEKYGVLKIKQKLFEKGVPADVIEDVLECADNADAAFEILRIKLRGNTLSEEDKPKLMRFLAQRGFTFDQSRKAIDRYSEEMNEYS